SLAGAATRRRARQHHPAQNPCARRPDRPCTRRDRLGAPGSRAVRRDRGPTRAFASPFGRGRAPARVRGADEHERFRSYAPLTPRSAALHGAGPALSQREREMIPLIPTTVVGSYPQPDWLVDRDKLLQRLPPRVRARDVWRVAAPFLEQAQDDATVLAVRDMERAGIDILTDGEIRRESYSNRFATALEGIDLDNPGQRPSRSGRPDIVPRVIGAIRRRHPVAVRDVAFLRANTDTVVKITVPGPFTMTQQAVDDFYHDDARLAMDFAVAVNDEIHDLIAAGADVIQIDEPYLQARVEAAREYAIEAINRALQGVSGRATTVMHTCFGYGFVV